MRAGGLLSTLHSSTAVPPRGTITGEGISTVGIPIIKTVGSQSELFIESR